MAADELLILTPEWSDAGTITPFVSGATPGSMGVGNLLTTQPSDVCRWTILSGAGAYLDLGAAREIDSIWLGYHNSFPTGATGEVFWRILAGDSLSAITTGGQDYDSGWLSLPEADRDDYDGRTHSLLRLDPAVTERWWGVFFDAAGHPDGFFEAGRMIIGKAYVPEAGVDYGAQIGYSETKRELATEGGQTYVRGTKRRAWQRISWEADSEDSAYDEVLRLSRLRGSSGEMVVCSKANDPARRMARTVYGVLDEPLVVSVPHYETYTVDLTVRELP